MRKLYFATTNNFKLKQAKEIFDGILEIEGVKLDLVEIQTLDQELISKHKAKQAFEILKQPVIVDDAGIFIEKYNQFPGVMTHHVCEGLGIENLSCLFNDNDKAQFRSVITYIDNEKEITVCGSIDGVIIKRDTSQIDSRNPFSSLFKVPEVNKFMHDLDSDELKLYSHRGMALKQLKEKIINI